MSILNYIEIFLLVIALCVGGYIKFKTKNLVDDMDGFQGVIKKDIKEKEKDKNIIGQF